MRISRDKTDENRQPGFQISSCFPPFGCDGVEMESLITAQRISDGSITSSAFLPGRGNQEERNEKQQG